MSEGPVASAAPAGATWTPKANPWLIAVVVTSAAFMEILDTTVVNVALPHIAGSLSAGTDEATWALTSYLVANGIVLPISGWFSSVLGRKRYFMICIMMFTLCSLLCGLATSLPQLVIFRILQGFFGGGLQPSQQSIILDTFPPAKRGAAFSVTAIATIVAPVLGPTLGGLITDSYSWRWIFFINVPFGALAWLAVMRLVEDPPWAKAKPLRENGRLQIDYIGLGLIALGLGCLEICLDRGEQEGWLGSPFIRTFGVIALLGIVGAVSWLLSVERPVVNLRVLKNRTFATGAFMIFVLGAVLYSSSVLLPQLAQQTLGYTALLSGLLLSPGGLVMIALIPLVSRILPKVQTRILIAIGFVLLGIALYQGHRLLSAQVSFHYLMMLRIYQMIGLSLLFVPISMLTFSTLKPEENRDAASLYTMFRNIAGSIGIAVSTSAITELSQVHQAYLSQHLSAMSQPYLDALARNTAALMARGVAATDLAGVANGQMFKTLITQANVMAYSDVFTYCAVFAFIAMPLAFLFPPTKAGGRGRPGAAE
jgi:DHA2 family multidrug resistance protein